MPTSWTPWQVNGMKDQRVPLSVLLPHELIHALATCNASLCFQSMMFGQLSGDDVSKFWHHVKRLEPWCWNVSGRRVLLFFLVKCFCIKWYDSWCNAVPVSSPTNRRKAYATTRRILFAHCLQFCLIDDGCSFFVTSWRGIYQNKQGIYPVPPDGAQVKRQVHKIVSEVCPWSLKHSGLGKAPETGFYGEPFASNTWRYGMRGRQLAGGIRPFWNNMLFSPVEVWYPMSINLS